MAKKQKNKKAKTLDLHGFPTEKVFDAVDRFIMAAAQSGQSQVRIMTGKGTGQVRQLTIDYLKKAGYPWQYEALADGRRNEGVLVVFMD